MTDDVLNGSYGASMNWIPYELVLGPDEDTTVYIIAQGSCGHNVTCQLGIDGKLIISGNGQMQFMMRSGAAPRSAYADKVTSIVVETGVESIAPAAFADCSNATVVTIADTVTSVGDEAFVGCESLEEINFSGDAPEIGENCFEDVTAVIRYPEDNATWTDDVLKDYGGDVTWTPRVIETTPMYRLYNPNADCGSHHYTSSTEERDNLVSLGWIYEGIGRFGMLR